MTRVAGLFWQVQVKPHLCAYLTRGGSMENVQEFMLSLMDLLQGDLEGVSDPLHKLLELLKIIHI